MATKSSMASKLLSSELRVRRQIIDKIKIIMDGVDMSLADRNSQVGKVYNNFGDLLKRVHLVGNTTKNLRLNLDSTGSVSPGVDPLKRLRGNMVKLEDMHARLQFMLGELEGLVKKA